jgi:hypothetical protein
MMNNKLNLKWFIDNCRPIALGDAVSHPVLGYKVMTRLFELEVATHHAALCTVEYLVCQDTKHVGKYKNVCVNTGFFGERSFAPDIPLLVALQNLNQYSTKIN